MATPAFAAPPEGTNGLLAELGRFPLNPESFGMIDGLVEALPDDPGTQDFLNTAIECALPIDTELVLGEGDRAVRFKGYWGFAPEWQDGPCEVACQEWVSACLMARTNAYGLPVSIFIAGDNPNLIIGEGRAYDDGYTVREAAFYGNIFTSPARSYACRGDGRDPLALTWRICGRPGARCGFQNVGPCGEVDGETGEAVAEPACTLSETGIYQNCKANLGRDDQVFTRVLTLFMKPTSFGGARVESCGEPPPSTPPAVSVGGMGTPCRNDTTCEDGLYCDVTYVGQGLCTRVCGEGDMEDEALCGDGTCLRSRVKNFCTPRCQPGEADACASGQICTGLWLQLERADMPGCLPFCTEDSHCGTGTYCNLRSGLCGEPGNPEGLDDGSPCDPYAYPTPCKGLCFSIDEDPTHGVCASLINRALVDDCPDRPGSMAPLRPGPGDDLALCLFRNCSEDDDCDAPLRCVRQPLNPGQCLY